MTDKSKGNHGISVLLVERDTPGFVIGHEEHKMGICASSTCELVFDNCRVPRANLLGREGKGLSIMLSLLDGGRITIAAQATGIAQGAINETIKYVKTRKQFGRRIADFQNTQFKLAEMQTRVDCARLMLYKTCALKDQGLPFVKEAAMAKYICAETAVNVTREAVQLFGGYGYTTDYPVERMMRDAKITEIYEGTSEIQKLVISRALLGA
jgi:butyryl-CoA dehydrogenase